MKRLLRFLRTFIFGITLGICAFGMTACSSTEKQATSYDFAVVSCTYNSEENTTKVIWYSNLVNDSIFDMKEESFKFDLYDFC